MRTRLSRSTIPNDWTQICVSTPLCQPRISPTSTPPTSPRLVDVGAESALPAAWPVPIAAWCWATELLSRVQAGEMPSHKGPVIHTAILAGIMGAKRTSELIPLCHPLGLDDCSLTIEPDGANALRVVCTAVVTGRTGVEMEALTGATVAALTIYDMCKAFLARHQLSKACSLLRKPAGKRDFHRAENSPKLLTWIICQTPAVKRPKHAALARPDTGEFGRAELAILGAPCGDIQALVARLLPLAGARNCAWPTSMPTMRPFGDADASCWGGTCGRSIRFGLRCHRALR